ncbi:hypothetical protein H0H87_011410, partial [Tephrocybe sp. NHM501043]
MPPPFVSVPTEPAPGNAIHYPVSEILFMMHRNALVLAGSDFPQIRPWTDLQSPYGCPRSFIYYPVFIVANYEGVPGVSLSCLFAIAAILGSEPCIVDDIVLCLVQDLLKQGKNKHPDHIAVIKCALGVFSPNSSPKFNTTKIPSLSSSLSLLSYMPKAALVKCGT